MASAVVGRADEAGRLSDLVRGARDGRFGAVVLEGDAGIGKTTLVAAACDAAGDDALILPGKCLPLTAVAVPLVGLRDAVRGLPPEQRPPLPGSGRPEVSVPVPVAFDEWLSEQAAARPVVLAVDDLHWADDETLDVLMYVLAGPAERRLAVVLTVRSSDVGPEHPLRRWLADARRLPAVREISVGPLTRDEVAQVVAGALGEEAHSSLVDEVFDRSRGNPYFARLLVAGVAPSARGLPPDLPEELSAAATRTWDLLSDDAKRLAVSLAMGGRPASGRALTRVAAVADVAEPGRALHELVATGFLDVDESGAYWFHHPLQAQALEQGLPPESRRVLHAGFASGYEEDVDDGLTAELAETISDHHVLGGNDADAYRWARTAAGAMGGAGSEVGRLRMLRRAADLHGSVGGTMSSRVSLWYEVRDAARRVADWDSEQGALEALLGLVDPRESPLEVAALVAWRVQCAALTARTPTVAEVETALELTRGASGSWQDVALRGQVARLLIWEDRRAEAAELLESVEPFEPGPDPHADALSAHAATMASAAHLAAREDDPTRARLLGRRAYELAAEVPEPKVMVAATMQEHFSQAEPAESARMLKERREHIQRLGLPGRWSAWLSATEALCLLEIGEVHRCTERLRVSLGVDSGPAIDVSARLTAAQLAVLQGRLAEGDAHLERARELITAHRLARMGLPYFSVKVRLLIEHGELEQAADVALEQLMTPGLFRPDRYSLLLLAGRVLADLASTARFAGQDPAGHLGRLEDLHAARPHVTAARSGGRDDVARAEALDGVHLAERLRAHGAEGEAEAWVAAVEGMQGLQLPWDEAYARWRAGEALLSRGDPAGRREAARNLRAGEALARRLGAQPVRLAIEALARSARITMREVGSADTSEADGGVALTPREREVLAHVVAGRTYAEIAESLFLSEKTVSSHISNILRKTGTANRVELASWAARMEPQS